jgi:GTP cyclohydrolase I
MSLDIKKTDAELGKQIEAHLKAKGVNTPTVTPYMTNESGNKARWPEGTDFELVQIAERFEQIMTILGLDITDDSLRETPTRVAKMLLQETMWGLKPANFPKCTTVENKMGYDEMVVEKNVTVQSRL